MTYFQELHASRACGHEERRRLNAKIAKFRQSDLEHHLAASEANVERKGLRGSEPEPCMRAQHGSFIFHGTSADIKIVNHSLEVMLLNKSQF